MNHRRTSPARVLAERLMGTQLRLKVMAGAVAVTLVALIAFDVGAVATVRRYLLTQTDSNLQVALTLTMPRLTAFLAADAPAGPAAGEDSTPCPREWPGRPKAEFWPSPAPSTWPSCRPAVSR